MLNCRGCCPGSDYGGGSTCCQQAAEWDRPPHSSLRVGFVAEGLALAVLSMPPCSWRFFRRPASTSLATLRQAGRQAERTQRLF